jgi:hypothetical protein
LKNEATDIYKANGISVYFPPGFKEMEDEDEEYWRLFYKRSKHQTLFAKEGNWKPFLDSYYQADKKINNEAG